MNSRLFWYMMMIGALALWVIAVLLGFYLFGDYDLLRWLPFCLLIVLHAVEVPIILKRNRVKALQPPRIALMTFVFGFTWWVPYEKGILDA